MKKSTELSIVSGLVLALFWGLNQEKNVIYFIFKLRQDMFYCYTSIRSTCCIHFGFWCWVWWFGLGRHNPATCSTCLYNKDVSLLAPRS